MFDLSELNEPQQQAARHEGGPLVVFAGAGSGKTRVITHRVAHLVEDCGIKPWRILAVTFTNKAAGEMRARLSRLMSSGADDLWVGTFHAICARLLRRYAEACGVRKDFVIYDDSDQKAMLTRIVRDRGLDERRYPPKQLAWRINSAKQECIGAADFDAGDGFDQVVAEVYKQYESRMRDCGALDFGDLIFKLVESMKREPGLLQELQSRWDHVLVDEFQDTNHVQYLLVQGLCAGHRNLCVVGDDDQSIYRWRGADRRNILDFQKHFRDANLIKLEQNYRSTQRILNVANAVVRHNLEREPKKLWTDNDEGSAVTVIHCPDEREEANTVVKTISFLLEAGYERKDIALLYRVHAQSRVFEETLRYANLPYRVIGGMRFYDRAEVKDLLAYLRVIHNPDDDVSLLRIINVPTRGLGKTTINRLLQSAARAGVSVWKAVQGASEDAAHGQAARKKLYGFRQLIEMLRGGAEGGTGPAVLAEQVLAETGYMEALQADDTAEADARLENIREVVGSMFEFERDAEEPTLTAFLELVTLQTDADSNDDDDTLTLMTVHAAKGLEFPVVVVAGLEEEMFPHRGFAPEDDPQELEEERRLAYVAFTRAEERLFLTHCQVRRIYGDVKFRQPSRFLDEMPQHELNFVGHKTRQTARSRVDSWNADPYKQPSQPQRTLVAGDSYVDTSEGSDLDAEELRLGMRVRHVKFGVGEVTEVNPGLPPRVTVSFPGWGSKQIVSSFLEPA